MFYKQTIKAKSVVDRVETAVEALNVSVNEFGYVNIPYMLSIYETDRDTLIKELDGIIFLNPDRYNENNPDAGWETADEYLSGNVRDKLRVAKAMAADTDDPQAERFAANAAALEKVQPEWIEASDIDVKIGTTWIEPLDYEQFIYELLNTPKRARAIRTEYYNSGIQVHLNKMNMEWFIENKSMDKHSVAATKTYGTSRMDAYSIFEETLNLKTVTVRDRIDDGDGKYHYEVNKNETKAVLAPMKAVRKLLVSMEMHLDASIDKLDNLDMTVQFDKEKRMEHTKDKEQKAPDTEREVIYSPMVAEPQEYKYNADAFAARKTSEAKQETVGKELPKVREDKAR